MICCKSKVVVTIIGNMGGCFKMDMMEIIKSRHSVRQY